MPARENPQWRPDTVLGHAGRDLEPRGGRAVNPPVVRASTVLFDSLDAWADALPRRMEPDFMQYGRFGTQTHFALNEAIARLEGADGALALPSGLAAIVATYLAFLGPGDHALVADTVYAPNRSTCLGLLARIGVETSFYDPGVGAGIDALIRPNTRLVFLEAPGSLTFEMQDVPAIAAAARARGIVTAIDNTWATPLYFRPLDHGVDVSIMAGTKYVVGHSDAMLGTIATTEAHYERIKKTVQELAYAVGADDAWLALRGLRTLSVRLARHQETGLALAAWLAARPEVARVFHPGLPGDPGHALWRRDFTGACGLFGLELEPVGDAAVAALVDGLELFGIGASWGGFESLVLPTRPEKLRTARPWDGRGPTLRFHAGLEDPQDLIDDLEAGFARLRAASG
ncbi:MAG: cystathionine beta-lyase [Tistlia sp.]|uniref:cystathionine beta-lyase n=1 Tax=Tistlia sp. TaxID=3057121 RepID=UPI0034A3739C